MKQSQVLKQDGPGESPSLRWKPTKKNRNTRPDLLEDPELDVRVHAVAFAAIVPDSKSAEMLYLVTTSDISRAQAIALYLHRYDVEHNICDMKVTLNTERTRAHSGDMFRKELLTSLVAYNLVVQFRCEAAERTFLCVG